MILAEFWSTFQRPLFTALSECLPEPLTDKQKQLISTLEIVRIEEHVPSPYSQWMGRPACDRRFMARAFIAKSIYDLPTTELLIEMLRLQPNLRRLCGWERFGDVPSSATFSRAFKEFADQRLGDHNHEALVEQHVGEQIVMHLSRDSTEVVARERAAKKEKMVKEPKKRGRPRKGEERPAPEPKRLDKQLTQSAEEAMAQLPTLCDFGTKQDTGGHKHTWKGWKAHIDWADGAIPINVVTTSASLHDSQVAVPMIRVTAQRVTSLYDLMDSAYDAPQIYQASKDVGHVPLIDPHPRRHGVPEDKLFDPAMRQRYKERTTAERYKERTTAERYKERTTAERGNSRLKDSFGLRHLRVRGHAKAHLHIMFGVLALFADQLMKPPTA